MTSDLPTRLEDTSASLSRTQAMVPWLILLASLPLSTTAGPSKTLGVSPDFLSKYTPSKSGTWKCLDGSKEISWDFVNDDSCDCPDGSDEPGRMLEIARRIYVEFLCQVPGPVRIPASTARMRDTLALQSQVLELMTVYVVCVIFLDIFYLVLSISRGAMLRWIRRTGWRLSKSLQGNRRGLSHETRCRIKNSKGGELRGCSWIFSRINPAA